jgi:hypothetical protein
MFNLILLCTCGCGSNSHNKKVKRPNVRVIKEQRNHFHPDTQPYRKVKHVLKEPFSVCVVRFRVPKECNLFFLTPSFYCHV